MNYLGLTLGPIYRTISNARKTRELWVSSYLFSWIMKRVLEELKTAKKNDQILTPFLDERNESIGAGLYSDRLIMKQQDGDFAWMIDILTSIMEELVVEKVMPILGGNKEDLVTFFKSYFKTYLVEIKVEADENPIYKINEYLDTVELYPTWIADEKENYVWSFIKKLNNSGKQIKKLFGEKLDIASLVEISTGDLENAEIGDAYKRVRSAWKDSNSSNQEEDEGEFITALKNDEIVGQHFKTYHKYIAIVHSDADSLGATIGQLKKNTNQFVEFSKAIIEVAKEAVEKIKQFNGLPIYAGGDDLLFFAPVFSGEKSIFHFVDELNDTFILKFRQLYKDLGIDENEISIPTLSFGISISYYKYPMAEAIEISRKLLFEKAKGFERKNGVQKNAIAYQILKHSGHSFGNVMGRGTEMYEIFKDLIGKEEDEKLLNSITYALESHAEILRLTAKEKQFIVHLFENNFDESIHQKEQIQEFIFGTIDKAERVQSTKGVTTLVHTAYQELGNVKIYNKERGEEVDKALESIYAVLRSMNFLKRQDNE